MVQATAAILLFGGVILLWQHDLRFLRTHSGRIMLRLRYMAWASQFAKDRGLAEDLDCKLLQAESNLMVSDFRFPATTVAAHADRFLRRYPASRHAGDVRWTKAGATLSADEIAALVRKELGRGETEHVAWLIFYEQWLGRLNEIAKISRRLEALGNYSYEGFFPVRLCAKGIPPFSVRGLNGESISRKGLAGRVALFYFWATWDGQSMKKTIPELDTLHRKMSRDGLWLIGVNTDGVVYYGDGVTQRVGVTKDEVRRWLAEHDIRWPHIYETAADDTGIRYRFGQPPPGSTVLIDRRGRLAAINPDPDKLESTIRNLLVK